MLHKGIIISIILVIIVVTGLIFRYYFVEIPKRSFSEINHFEDDKQKNWTTIFPEYISDMQYNSSPTSYKLTEKMEWGPAFSLPIQEMSINKSDWLDISINIYCADSKPPEVILLASLDSCKKEVFRNAAYLRNCWIKPGWNSLSLRFNLINLPQKQKNLVFKTHIWNKGLNNIFVDDYQISVKPLNP